MQLPCEPCAGHGQTTPDHSNDPDARIFQCEDCDGTGEVAATPSDLDGKRATYIFITGWLTWNRANDTLTLEDDETGVTCVNLLPDHVQVHA